MEQVNEVERLKAINWELAKELNTARDRIVELEEGQITQRKFNHEYAKLKNQVKLQETKTEDAEKRFALLQFQMHELYMSIRQLLPPEQSQDGKDSTLLSQQIQFTHLPSRIQIAFQYNNILTYEHLSNASPFDILRIPNVGEYSYHKLKRHLLQKFGRAFCDRNFAQHEI